MSALLDHDRSARPFAGTLGEDYDFIKQMCPNVPTLHAVIATIVTGYRATHGGAIRVLEIGCGTGLLTAALLTRNDSLQITAIDNEPTMLRQARLSLQKDLDSGRLELREADALDFLLRSPAGGFDVIASAYCLHNFAEGYRTQALQEILRVLRPGGLVINGDRYALDDLPTHTQAVQQEVAHYFSTFKALNRLDLLEKWIVHLIGDEAPDHVMRESAAIAAMQTAGFERIEWHFRAGIDGLLSAMKPQF